MLGEYEFFPTVIHGEAQIAFSVDRKTLQLAIVEALHRLNSEVEVLSHIMKLGDETIYVSFEFGVAEGSSFFFIDEEELDRLRGRIKSKPLEVIDVFYVLKYHKVVNGKRRPLKFDYGFLRFLFRNDHMHLLFHHERGTMRISFSDLTRFLLQRVCILLKNESSKIFKVVRIREI